MHTTIKPIRPMKRATKPVYKPAEPRLRSLNEISPNMIKYRDMGVEVLTLSPNWECWPTQRDLEILEILDNIERG